MLTLNFALLAREILVLWKPLNYPAIIIIFKCKKGLIIYET